mmetsp:Transcript_72752/g.170598  ORF Transcript_72752/g.170598 Transcript_72752/m.170598 type:complete len:368 (-) Transcript_72752:132-1235(-)
MTCASVSNCKALSRKHTFHLEHLPELLHIPIEIPALQVCSQVLSLGDIAHRRHQIHGQGIGIIVVVLVFVEPGFDGSNLVDLNLCAVNRVGKLCAEDMANLGVSRDKYLSTAKPDANGLLNVLSTPHIHAIVVLTRFMPPLFRDAEESTTHTWNQVISVIKPFEVELPVEHHLHSHRATVDCPLLSVQDGNQGHNNPFVIDVHMSENWMVPISSWFDMCVEEHDHVSSCKVATLDFRLDEPTALIVTHQFHLRVGCRDGFQRWLAAIVDHDDLNQCFWRSCLQDRIERALQVVMLIVGRHDDRDGLDRSIWLYSLGGMVRCPAHLAKRDAKHRLAQVDTHQEGDKRPVSFPHPVEMEWNGQHRQRCQ